jgi:hypothetical protein
MVMDEESYRFMGNFQADHTGSEIFLKWGFCHKEKDGDSEPRWDTRDVAHAGVFAIVDGELSVESSAIDNEETSPSSLPYVPQSSAGGGDATRKVITEKPQTPSVPQRDTGSETSDAVQGDTGPSGAAQSGITIRPKAAVGEGSPGNPKSGTVTDGRNTGIDNRASGGSSVPPTTPIDPSSTLGISFRLKLVPVVAESL